MEKRNIFKLEEIRNILSENANIYVITCDNGNQSVHIESSDLRYVMKIMEKNRVTKQTKMIRIICKNKDACGFPRVLKRKTQTIAN